MVFSDSDISREERVPIGGGQYEGPFAGGLPVDLTVAGQEALERAENLLAGIPGGVEKAIRSAMARSAAHLKTRSSKVARERYDIKAANIREAENAKISYSYQNGVQAHIIFAGQRIPLYRFGGASPSVPTKDTSSLNPVMVGMFAGNLKGRWKLLHPSVPARGHVLKSTSPVWFQSAFVARMKSGHVGIYERTGGMTSNDKDEVEELFGPSVPQMLGSPAVAEKLSKEAMEKFEDRLEHEINAILNGWR